MAGAAPVGYRLLRSLIFHDSYSRHAVYVFVLTFWCYTFYHASRRPISVAKGVLHKGQFTTSHPNSVSVGWPPFDQNNWSQLIGSLEYAYLSAYAIALMFSGYLAERINLRSFLAYGMILSGVCNIAFGAAYYWDIHVYSYFMYVQLISGIVQSSGWPAVVTLMGNWWGEKRRGFIMGLWNAHTSIGNILGSVVAGYYVDKNWGAAFIVPGLILIAGAVVVCLTLVSRPEMIDLPGFASKSSSSSHPPRFVSESSSEACLLSRNDGDADNDTPSSTDSSSRRAITFWAALVLPNVLAYSILLFFAKLVSYTFLYWLPNYLAVVEHNQLTAERAAQLSVVFDVGGILGGILAGLFSDSKEHTSDADVTWRRAITCSVMLAIAAPLLLIYRTVASARNTLSLVTLFFCGLVVNGPYALITTAVSTDLGTQPALQGRARALATVTAIIDGTGSFGAALGPFLTGLLVPFGWSAVFTMLVIADLCALALSMWIAYRARRWNLQNYTK